MGAVTATCPCCGQAVEADPLAAARAVLTPMQRRVLDAVVRRPGLSPHQVADVVYAEDPNGGPDGGGKTVQVYVCTANKRLAALGWRITQGGSGFRNGYRLERLP